MIVEKRKCIFIHIPKTGGTSIEYFFKKKGGQRKHALPRKIKKEFPSKWENYYKFAFVRNPWDKMVSQYFYNHRKYFPKGISFEKYIDRWGNGKNVSVWPLSYEEWLDPDIDFIGRFENFQDDFNLVCDAIGIPARKVPHRRPRGNKWDKFAMRRPKKHYSEHYSEESMNIVGTRFKDFIKKFNYKFK